MKVVDEGPKEIKIEDKTKGKKSKAVAKQGLDFGPLFICVANH